MRLAHSLADTLVSPINDSYIDVDVFSRVQHDRSQRGAISQYAELVREARRKRRIVDNGLIDWVVVRNRIASIASNNARQIAVSVGRLAQELRFRVADGLHDRVIFRELFPIGLTALDPIEQGADQGALTSSQLAARREIEKSRQFPRAALAPARRRSLAVAPAVARQGRALLRRRFCGRERLVAAAQMDVAIVIARRKATKQSSQGSQSSALGCFAPARHDGFTATRFAPRFDAVPCRTDTRRPTRIR